MQDILAGLLSRANIESALRFAAAFALGKWGVEYANDQFNAAVAGLAGAVVFIVSLFWSRKSDSAIAKASGG